MTLDQDKNSILAEAGIKTTGKVHWNLTPEQLSEVVLQSKEIVKTPAGALVAKTGNYAGRAPKAKYFVREAPLARARSGGER